MRKGNIPISSLVIRTILLALICALNGSKMPKQDN